MARNVGVEKKFKCAIQSVHKSEKINLQKYQLIHHLSMLKRGDMIGFNGFKRITSMKLML